MKARAVFAGLSPAARYGLASAILLLLAVIFVRPLTDSMALHMLVHIPVILFAGICAARGLSMSRCGAGKPGFFRRTLQQYRQFDEFGVPGLLLASLAGAYWMLPKALDQVQVCAAASVLKFFVLFLLGMVLLDSLRRANAVIKLFFLGGFCWMAAVVGILYQSDSVRLCNAYLLDDQLLAGRGLVVLSIVLPLLWLAVSMKVVRRFLSR